MSLVYKMLIFPVLTFFGGIHIIVRRGICSDKNSFVQIRNKGYITTEKSQEVCNVKDTIKGSKGV